MILRLAMRSLLAHAVRSAVLAGGFGIGIAVMANLLGVAEVVLEESQAPALAGGGDVVITGVAGPVTSARYLLWGILDAPALAPRVTAASPTARGALYLVQDGKTTRLRARGGIPSLERALADPETSFVPAWRDAPGDAAWASPRAADVLRALDRFHPIPDVPARAHSWLEWLYFNGQADGTRFYLTLLVGPMRDRGRRTAGVRLQLERDGVMTTYGEGAEVADAEVLSNAPEITIGSSHVQLDGDRYRVSFDLPAARDPGGRGRGATRTAGGDRATGEVILTARRGHALPPLTLKGAAGWVSGYVVPVMSGTLDGTIRAGGRSVSLAGGTGYHDHNWGFWEGVSWQWGQVQRDGLSVLYGRVFPPSDVADASRVPGFLMVLGPDGPLGQAGRVTVEETDDPALGRPRRILVRGMAPSLDLQLDLEVESGVRTAMVQGPLAAGRDFLQLRGTYRVSGQAGDRRLDFTAMGSAETFRGR